jgi:hypothetical protein
VRNPAPEPMHRSNASARWHRAVVAATACVAAAFLGAAGPCQATLTQLTSSLLQHVDAAISPDGSHVGFRVANQSLGSVVVVSGVETIVFTSTGSGLTSFVWSPSSTTLFFADGNAVRAVGRSGGPALNLGTVAGISANVSCTSPDGASLFGTRQELGMAHVFRVATNGQTPPVDLITVAGTIDEVSLDRTGRFLLYRVGAGIPFTPMQYRRHDLVTGADTLLYTTSGVDAASSGRWLDDGQTMVLASISPNVGQFHLGRIGPSGVRAMLTDFQYPARRPSVYPGSGWILCETLNPDLQGVTVGAMPTTGGGLVLLEGGRSLWFNVGSLNSMSGGLGIDGFDLRLAASAGTSPTDPMAQIYIASLDREIRVHPRLVVGGAFTIDLPVAAGEFGAVALTFGLSASPPITVPTLTGAFYLDPVFAPIVVMGVGTGAGPLSTTLPIPGDPTLRAARIFFQGARSGSTGGAFTRWGHAVVH